MKLIGLLIALGLVAYLTTKQMAADSPSDEVRSVLQKHEVDLPRVSNDPQDLKGFEEDMNTFVQSTKSDIDSKLDDIEETINQ